MVLDSTSPNERRPPTEWIWEKTFRKEAKRNDVDVADEEMEMVMVVRLVPKIPSFVDVGDSCQLELQGRAARIVQAARERERESAVGRCLGSKPKTRRDRFAVASSVSKLHCQAPAHAVLQAPAAV